jgi:hypothetical protein
MRTEGLNLRGVFMFAIERYCAQVLASLVASKITGRRWLGKAKSRPANSASVFLNP